MSDIIFSSLPDGYFAPVSHGQGARSVFAKLDTGASISYMNMAAIQYLINANCKQVSDAIRSCKAPSRTLHGFNGSSSEVFLCRLSNIFIGDFLIRKMYVAVGLSFSADIHGNVIPKFLFGRDLLRQCSGHFSAGGDMTLTPVIEDNTEAMNADILIRFQTREEDVFSIAELLDNQ